MSEYRWLDDVIERMRQESGYVPTEDDVSKRGPRLPYAKRQPEICPSCGQAVKGDA